MLFGIPSAFRSLSPLPFSGLCVLSALRYLALFRFVVLSSIPVSCAVRSAMRYVPVCLSPPASVRPYPFRSVLLCAVRCCVFRFLVRRSVPASVFRPRPVLWSPSAVFVFVRYPAFPSPPPVFLPFARCPFHLALRHPHFHFSVSVAHTCLVSAIRPVWLLFFKMML